MTPVALAALALALAHPVPRLLGRAGWPLRSPRGGIVLWQSLALAAVLASLGAGAAAATSLVAGRPTERLHGGVQSLVLALATTVALRLAWAVVSIGRRTRRARDHHRLLLDVLAEREPGRPALRILDDPAARAYCLPARRRRARVVVSRGALEALEPDELAAVLAHEDAHVRARHDLVLEGFLVLHRAFPRGPRGAGALAQARVMVELLADDAARREGGAGALHRALMALDVRPAPTGALGAGGVTALRLQRLEGDPRPHLVDATACYLLAAAVIVVPTVTLVVPWLTTTWQALAR